MDPLFQKMSAVFDSAGTNGLLLSQLHTLDDCTVVFDGTTSVKLDTNTHRTHGSVDITQLKGCSYLLINLIEYRYTNIYMNTVIRNIQM